MRVSLDWLREYVDVTGAPAAVAQRLTGAGVAVETLTTRAGSARNIVAGRITAVAAHADADTLLVCQVEAGAHGQLQIVTGAPNVYAGAMVPVALPGSALPTGQEIGRADFRGVASAGMLCAPDELGIPEGHDGILILPEDVAPGADVLDLLGLRDTILELDLTANYATHCQCLVGVAQEWAAQTHQAVRWPEPRVNETGRGHIRDRARVRIADPDLCPRYACRLIDGVTSGPSPLWLQRRLRAAGMRPINNIVDITNFVMLELGQPLHAFSFDCLAGGEVVARRARAGERIRTLDGQDRILDEDVLVIADAERPHAIAGVMGGEDSEVTAATTTVLLESAAFHGGNNRRTSRRYGLPSEASSRFSKGVDPSGVIRALDRAAALMVELAGGRVVPGIIDEYPQPVVPAVIPLRLERLQTMLGTALPAAEVAGYLQRLGFGVLPAADYLSQAGRAQAWALVQSVSPVPAEPAARAAWEAEARPRVEAAAANVSSADGSTADSLVAVVPTRRLDIAIEVDLIEEVVRLHGYDQVAATLPRGEAVRGGRPRHQEVALAVRRRLAGAGLAEVMTYSLVPPRVYDQLRLPADAPERKFLALSNPMYEERSTLRTLLVPSLLDVAQYNVNRQLRDLALFEVAPVYLPAAGVDLPAEPVRLGLLLAGRAQEKGWNVAERAYDFYHLKGVVAHLLAGLGIGQPRWERSRQPYLHPGRQAALVLKDAEEGMVIGTCGELHPAVQAAWGLPDRTYVAELDFAPLAAATVDLRPYQPVPRHPAALRDVSLVIDRDVPAAAVAAAIIAAGGALVESARLFDQYEGAPVPMGKRSLAYAITYRAEDRTLNDAEVESAHNAVRTALVDLGAELRS